VLGRVWEVACLVEFLSFLVKTGEDGFVFRVDCRHDVVSGEELTTVLQVGLMLMVM